MFLFSFLLLKRSFMVQFDLLLLCEIPVFEVHFRITAVFEHHVVLNINHMVERRGAFWIGHEFKGSRRMVFTVDAWRTHWSVLDFEYRGFKVLLITDSNAIAFVFFWTTPHRSLLLRQFLEGWLIGLLFTQSMA